MDFNSLEPPEHKCKKEEGPPEMNGGGAPKFAEID